MVKLMIDSAICCTNSDLYDKKKKGHYCSSEDAIGEKCSFCEGIYVKKEYWIDKKHLEVRLPSIKRSSVKRGKE